tara:strand:+ start:191 stop:1033 length:843 start_codon:yes stop_codon:yes gene_type:complete
MKHYDEQKLLIENFRKWQSESLDEQEQLDEILPAEFSDGFFIWDMLQLLAIPTANLFMIAPYLKIAVHHPRVQKVLMGKDSDSSGVFRAMALGLKGADNAGTWLQKYVDSIFKSAKEGEELNAIERLKKAIKLLAFLAVLGTTTFPAIFAGLIHAVPRIGLFIKKLFKQSKEKGAELKAKVKGEPTPKELEQAEQQKQLELQELQELEQEKAEATAAAKSVSEVVDMIKQDPLAIAEKLGVELSDADIENMKIDSPKKPKSKAVKFEPSKKKKPVVNDED